MKCKSLIQQYILPGSDLEINISYKMRNPVISVYEDLKKPYSKSIDLYTVFDEALTEISGIIQDGQWKEFVLSREIKVKSRLIVVSRKIHSDSE